MFELFCEILRIFFWNGSAAPNLFVHANATVQWGPNWRKVLIYGQNWISGLSTCVCVGNTSIIEMIPDFVLQFTAPHGDAGFERILDLCSFIFRVSIYST